MAYMTYDEYQQKLTELTSGKRLAYRPETDKQKEAGQAYNKLVVRFGDYARALQRVEPSSKLAAALNNVAADLSEKRQQVLNLRFEPDNDLLKAIDDLFLEFVEGETEALNKAALENKYSDVKKDYDRARRWLSDTKTEVTRFSEHTAIQNTDFNTEYLDSLEAVLAEALNKAAAKTGVIK